jgi:hypothetical protein
LLRAGDDTDAAAQAMLIRYGRFEFFGAGDLTHLDGIELAAVDTGLTPAAELLIHSSTVSTRSKNLMHLTAVEQGIDHHAAVIAATAVHVSLRGIQRDMDQSMVLTVMNYCQTFFKSNIFGGFDKMGRFAVRAFTG